MFVFNKMQGTTKAKYRSVVRTLRDNIIQGIYLPGHRLPNRSEMVTQFGVSMATVQRAFDALIEDGFVRAQARNGTFVAEHPPHLCSYGLVISSAQQWSRYFMAVREAVETVKTDDVQFREYSTSREIGSRADVAQLCKDVQHHRLAGLIFAGLPNDLRGTPALDNLDIPRVIIERNPQFDLPMVFGDLASFLERAVAHLFSKGRRRIAHLRVDYPGGNMEEFEITLRQLNVETRPYWILPIPMGSSFRSAKHIVHLLMRLRGEDRPDALIVHDDNLVEHAVAGLVAAGVKVPEELDVIAQCNYPSPVPSVLPIKRLGFDVRAILEQCLRIIELQRKGGRPPEQTMVPAVFEDELGEEIE